MVSEKRIRQLAEEKKQKVTDKELFAGPMIKQYLQELVDIVIKKEVNCYNRLHDRKYDRLTRIDVQPLFDITNTTVAFAASMNRKGSKKENLRIMINIGHEMFKDVTDRTKRLLYMKGLLAHECSHIIYTDFRLNERTMNNIKEGMFDLVTHKLTDEDILFRENYEDICDFLKKKENRMLFASIVGNIDNMAEDGFIEQTFIDRNKGSLAEGLYELRWFHFNSIPKVRESLEPSIMSIMTGVEENPVYQAVMQAYLCYAKYRTVKADTSNPQEKEIVDIIKTCQHELDLALASMDASKRKEHINNTIVILWKYIKDYIEMVKESQKDGDDSGSGSGSASERINRDHESLKGQSVINTEINLDAIYKPSPDEGDTPPEENETEETKAETPESENTDDSEEEPENEDDDPGNESDDSSEEGDDPEEENNDPSENPSDIVRDNNYIPDDESYRSARDMIENLISEIAKDEAEKEAENERTEELNEEAKKMPLGNMNNSIPLVVKRMSAIPQNLYEEYNAITPPLIAISKMLQKRISQKLKDRRRGGKQTGLYFGRKLDARTLIRNDGRHFYKNKLPQKEPELCVAILLDESGSMMVSKRYAYTRAAGFILYDFCEALGIPVAVYGHDENWPSPTVNLYSYAEFESIDKKDRYRIMDVQPRNNNRDGAALRYMYNIMKKRPEPNKLLFIVSDGAPNASGYGGSKAKCDIQDAVAKAKANNIVTIAAAIGEDRDEIVDIYGKESFLDITNLDSLPVIITEHVIRALKL